MAYKEAVKKLRLKMLMTQDEFAKLLDVSFATINRWETGKYVPTIKARRRLQPYFEKYNSNSKRCWLQYAKGIISGAKYLSQFKNYNEFKKTCDDFDSSDITREAYSLLLSTKIDNMGFAIACNWLKELGYKNYPKPDIHMRDVSYAFGLIDEKKKDIDFFETMVKGERACNVGPYKLDKLWWLICSGNFYRYNKQLKNHQKNKEDFINLIAKNI